MMRLFITAPDIWPGDAVGNHCMSIVRNARRRGLEAHAFAQRFAGQVAPIEVLFDECTSEDILLVSYSIYDPYLEQLLALPCRKLCYFHGVTTPDLVREFDPVTAALCERSVKQFTLLSHFDSLLANSRLTVQSLAPYLDTNRVQVVPPVSSDMPIFQHCNAPRHKRETLELLVVGRVVPHKRIEDAIEVMAQVRAKGRNAQMRVVGSAVSRDYSTYLAELSHKLGVQQHVFFAGILDEQKLIEHYYQADALLSVSRHEGFCVPVLEAMHLGLPVFVRTGTASSEVGEGAAMVFNGLAQASDAICQMHGNLELCNAMSKAGKRRAAKVLATADDAIFKNIFQEECLTHSPLSSGY